MRQFLLSLALAVGIAISSASGVFATDNGNGVDVTWSSINGNHKVHAEWYTAFDPVSATYIYNESGGTDVDSGELDTSFIVDKGNILVSIPTLDAGSGTITMRIEGRTKGSAVWANVYTKAYTTATTIAEVFPINSYFDAIRIGLTVTNTPFTDDVTVEGDFVVSKYNRGGP